MKRFAAFAAVALALGVLPFAAHAENDCTQTKTCHNTEVAPDGQHAVGVETPGPNDGRACVYVQNGRGESGHYYVVAAGGGTLYERESDGEYDVHNRTESKSDGSDCWFDGTE